MPPLTYSSSDTDSGSSHEGLEIFPTPMRKDGEMSGETEKGYNTHMIVVGSEEANLTDNDSISITGDSGKNGAGDEHIDRISLLKDIYTTTMMIEDEPGPESQ